MASDPAENQSPKPSKSQHGYSRTQTASGVQRLIRGAAPKTSTAQRPATHPLADISDSNYSSPRAPDWIFYLADVAVLFNIVWLIMINDWPLSGRLVTFCIILSFVAAGLGVWPWLRNILHAQTIEFPTNLPPWSMLQPDNHTAQPRHLMIHLRQPFVVVEIVETPWKSINAKPDWLGNPPNLPPERISQLLAEATDFFHQWKRRKETEAASSDAANPTGDRRDATQPYH